MDDLVERTFETTRRAVDQAIDAQRIGPEVERCRLPDAITTENERTLRSVETQYHHGIKMLDREGVKALLSVVDGSSFQALSETVRESIRERLHDHIVGRGVTCFEAAENGLVRYEKNIVELIEKKTTDSRYFSSEQTTARELSLGRFERVVAGEITRIRAPQQRLEYALQKLAQHEGDADRVEIVHRLCWGKVTDQERHALDLAKSRHQYGPATREALALLQVQLDGAQAVRRRYALSTRSALHNHASRSAVIPRHLRLPTTIAPSGYAGAPLAH